jgi:hypothetical protein
MLCDVFELSEALLRLQKMQSHSDEYVEYKRIEGVKKHRTWNAKQKKMSFEKQGLLTLLP